METLIVTALYDIGRENWKYYPAHESLYLEWIKNMLSIKCDIVIFTDSVLYEKVVEVSALRENKTLIIKKELGDLYMSQFASDITRVMSEPLFRSNIRHNVPEMLYPLYNILMYNKLFFMQDAKSLFKYDFYMWMDAGCFRESLPSHITWPNAFKLDRDRVTHFVHQQPLIGVRNSDYLFSQIRNIHGGCFVIPSKLISVYCSEFNRVLASLLNKGTLGSDEKLFDLCYLINPKMYRLIVSGWREYFKLLT